MNFDQEGVVTGFQLFPIGETKLSLDNGDMILTLSETDIQVIVNRATSANLRTPIDGDHFLHHLALSQGIDEDKIAESAPYSNGLGTLGFGTLTKKPDGVWIEQIKWNDTARFLLKNGQYKYFSPVIKGLDKRLQLSMISKLNVMFD